jgi:hypothetical protein
MKPQVRKLALFAAAGGLLLGAALVYAADAVSVSKARELLQRLAGANLSKDQVQIKKISAGATANEAVVEAQIETAFRLTKEKGEWRIADVRLGDRQWESFELIEEAVRREKVRRTNALLKQMADAIEAYRKDRGQAPRTDDIAELLDYLSPRYLNPPLRFDLWGRQFEYQDGAGGYRLRSAGPDRKAGTNDDLVVENGVLRAALE